jgi:hypothetical protein
MTDRGHRIHIPHHGQARRTTGLDRLVATLGLGSPFAIGYVNGMGGVYQVAATPGSGHGRRCTGDCGVAACQLRHGDLGARVRATAAGT